MGKKKDIDSLVSNILDDLKRAPKKDIDKIHQRLKELLNKYDSDPFVKDVVDGVKRFFTFDKRKKCALLLVDIIDSINNDDFASKESLRKDLLELSNIYRTFLENIISLIGNS